MTRPHEPFESALPGWVRDALRDAFRDAFRDASPDAGPESSDRSAAARARVMAAVRAAPVPRTLSAPMRPTRWVRRGVLSPIGGLMATVVMALTVLLHGDAGRSAGELVTLTQVLGDSVVPANIRSTDAAGSGRWLDTMRVVEFVIRGSTIHAASVLGDFNRWRRGATPMVASLAGREWRARVLVPRDALAMVREASILVNDADLVAVTRQ
jgi:hypothetical protein